jgi:acetyl-CoA carboxylase carboxyl transferase subunit alpha
MDSPSKAHHNLEALERQIEQLKALAGDNQGAIDQLTSLREKVEALRGQMQMVMSAWQRTELARHPQRPYSLDYIDKAFEDFSEIHGDRAFGDDPAIICGMAKLDGENVMVIGHQKARDTKQKVYRNFGMPNPEGYRKALRAMRLAEKFGRPIITFVDTPGAYPGLGAEERGQGEAIARNLLEMSRLKVPIITTVTGEGGSGGALAIAVADRVLMMENSVYSVISPEGCASIMWRDASKREIAAAAMKITAPDMLELRLVDGVVPEPDGGAHNDHQRAADILREALLTNLRELRSLSTEELLKRRYDKFRHIGQYFQVQ